MSRELVECDLCGKMVKGLKAHKRFSHAEGPQTIADDIAVGAVPDAKVDLTESQAAFMRLPEAQRDAIYRSGARAPITSQSGYWSYRLCSDTKMRPLSNFLSQYPQYAAVKFGDADVQGAQASHNVGGLMGIGDQILCRCPKTEYNRRRRLFAQQGEDRLRQISENPLAVDKQGHAIAPLKEAIPYERASTESRVFVGSDKSGKDQLASALQDMGGPKVPKPE